MLPLYAALPLTIDSYCDETYPAYTDEDSTMPTASTLYLEFDKTGLSPDNLIPYETHDVANTATRLIIPKFGAFYTESLAVFAFDPFTGEDIPLTKGVDYLPTEMLHKATAHVGAEVCTVILITEPSNRTRFRVRYQALGGHNQIHRDNLFALMEQIQNPTEQVDYYDIVNKPKGYYPAPHLQDALDIYGLEYIRDAVNKLDNAIITTDRQTHQELITQIDQEVTTLNDLSTSGVYDNVDTTMTIVKGVEDALVITHDITLQTTTVLQNTNTAIAALEQSIMDYKATNYNDALANVANLLCKRNFDNAGPEVNVPAIIAPGDRVLYLMSDSYNAVTGVWPDQTSGMGSYTAISSHKPTKAASATNPAIEAVRFTPISPGQYLTRSTGLPVEVSADSTVFVVAAPTPGTNYIKLDLFADANHSISIDTRQCTGFKASDLDGSNITYHGKIARTLGSKATVIVSTVASRETDNITLSSSPYNVNLTANGVNTASLDSANTSTVANTIGTANDTQNADVFMILVYNRLLSRTEIHAILTFIRTQYDTAVQYIENGDYTNWDVGFGSDLQNTIDFINRGSVAVTDRAIALWDTTNTYSQPGTAYPSDIKIDSHPYLLVLSKDATKAFWRQTVNLDIHCRHEFKFSIVYGQESLPSIRFKINGIDTGNLVALNPTQSLVRDYVLSFTPTVQSNRLELFNLNESTTGNCFGIGAMSIQRKIYAN